jgi:predicted 3-demethylubiquinone-9 3-methyltransferase (glyoxalase superfamily)
MAVTTSAPRIHPFLWFENNAEEAMNFYVSVFPDSKILGVTRWGTGGMGPQGSVMTASFRLAGQQVVILNGGPQFKLSPAISFVVNCTTQAEIDGYWEALLGAGGTSGRCGWLTDRFGLSWQVVPAALPEMLTSARAGRVSQVMLQMVKLDLDALQRAYEGTS